MALYCFRDAPSGNLLHHAMLAISIAELIDVHEKKCASDQYKPDTDK